MKILNLKEWNFPSKNHVLMEEFGSLKDYKPVYYTQKFECGHSEEKLLNPLCAEHYPTNSKWKEWVLIIGGSLIAGPIIYYFAGIVLAITNGQ